MNGWFILKELKFLFIPILRSLILPSFSLTKREKIEKVRNKNDKLSPRSMFIHSSISSCFLHFSLWLSISWNITKKREEQNNNDWWKIQSKTKPINVRTSEINHKSEGEDNVDLTFTSFIQSSIYSLLVQLFFVLVILSPFIFHSCLYVCIFYIKLIKLQAETNPVNFLWGKTRYSLLKQNWKLNRDFIFFCIDF